MMHSTGREIAYPGFLKERQPRVGVKMFGLPHGYEVLVSEFAVMSIGPNVVLVHGIIFIVHPATVPLTAFGY